MQNLYTRTLRLIRKIVTIAASTAALRVADQETSIHIHQTEKLYALLKCMRLSPADLYRGKTVAADHRVQ